MTIESSKINTYAPVASPDGIESSKISAYAAVSDENGLVASKVIVYAIVEAVEQITRTFDTAQDGDVLLFEIEDRGEINIEFGITQMTQGFETALYLSLFGGNEDDDGRSGSALTWFGNLSEQSSSYKYVSRTQNLIRGLSATSGNLKRIVDAAKTDLQWLLDESIASAVDVSATIPELNKIKLSVTISARGDEHRFAFTENWKSYLT